MGSSGSVLFNKRKNKFFYADGFAHKIVDKIGAGDTMLSLIGPCIKSNADSDISLLISSLAAAQSVETIGNKYTIGKTQILKLEFPLKYAQNTKKKDFHVYRIMMPNNITIVYEIEPEMMIKLWKNKHLEYMLYKLMCFYIQMKNIVLKQQFFGFGFPIL